VSDELNKLRRRLEQATAAERPSGVPLDAETASLREGWLALGQLLEAAQPALGEPLKLREPVERTSRARWRRAGAVAAALLIGVTSAWEWTRSGRHDGASSMPALSSRTAADIEHPVAPSKQPQLAPTEDELEWNDPLDQQITLVAQEVVRVQQDWYRLDEAFSPVHRGLEQMEADLEENTL